MREHGTRACYLAGCRQPECIAAHSRYSRDYHRDRIRPDGQTRTVEPSEARVHVQWLRAHGASQQAIADAAGVARCSVRHLEVGRSQRLHRSTAERILAVHLSACGIDPGATVTAKAERLPWAPLAALVARLDGVTTAELTAGRVADVAGVTPRTIERWQARGVPFGDADRICCDLGVWLGSVWPETIEEAS